MANRNQAQKGEYQFIGQRLCIITMTNRGSSRWPKHTKPQNGASRPSLREMPLHGLTKPLSPTKKTCKLSRTTRETQDAILLMRRTAGCVSSLSALRNGAPVHDVKACIRCTSGILSLWKRVSALVPDASPRTAALHRLVRAGLEAVERRLDACSEDKALARTSLASLASR